MGQALTKKSFYVVSEDAYGYLKVKQAHRKANVGSDHIVFVTPEQLTELVFDQGSTMAFDTRVNGAYTAVMQAAQKSGASLLPFEPEDLSQLTEYFRR